jgi:hypothetical protein
VRQILPAEIDAGQVAVEQDGSPAAGTRLTEPSVAAKYFGQFGSGAFDQLVQGTSLI